jgi:hypothetical protein
LLKPGLPVVIAVIAALVPAFIVRVAVGIIVVAIISAAFIATIVVVIVVIIVARIAVAIAIIASRAFTADCAAEYGTDKGARDCSGSATDYGASHCATRGIVITPLAAAIATIIAVIATVVAVVDIDVAALIAIVIAGTCSHRGRHGSTGKGKTTGQGYGSIRFEHR